MRSHHDPWKWPFALGLAALMTASLFFVIPLAWLDPLFRMGDRLEPPEKEPPPWLILAPPPQVEAEREPEITPPEKLPPSVPALTEDPRWWSEGWRIRVETEAAAVVPTVQDSVGYLLSALGVGQDLLSLSRPDSVLASRLAFMELEDSFAFDELKPYLGAMTRSRAYADIMSRAADMYDDFLQSKIMVPD